MQVATAKKGTNTQFACEMKLIRGSARKGYNDGGGILELRVYLD